MCVVLGTVSRASGTHLPTARFWALANEPWVNFTPSKVEAKQNKNPHPKKHKTEESATETVQSWEILYYLALHRNSLLTRGWNEPRIFAILILKLGVQEV